MILPFGVLVSAIAVFRHLTPGRLWKRADLQDSRILANLSDSLKYQILVRIATTSGFLAEQISERLCWQFVNKAAIVWPSDGRQRRTRSRNLF
jgi:hypothetical protein